MKKYLVPALAILVIIAGCSMMGQGGKQTVVGTWVGSSPELGEMTFVFNDDGTTHINLSGMNMEMDGKYEVDYNADPMTLDQFGFEDSMMGDMRYLGIFKFTDANTIVLSGNPDTMGDRPTDFNGSSVIELKRK